MKILSHPFFSSERPIMLLMAWTTIVPLTSSATITYYLIHNQDWFADWNNAEWLVFFAVTGISMALAITPTTFVAIVCGYFMGFVSLPYVVFAYLCASIIGFFLARVLDHDFLGRVLIQFPKAKGVLENIEHKQLVTVILSRISPALPFALMNVILAISKIRFWKFFLGGLIGMLPRTLFSMWLGVQANELNEALQQRQNVWWVILPTVLVFGLFYWLLRPSRVPQNTR